MNKKQKTLTVDIKEMSSLSDLIEFILKKTLPFKLKTFRLTKQTTLEISSFVNKIPDPRLSNWQILNTLKKNLLAMSILSSLNADRDHTIPYHENSIQTTSLQMQESVSTSLSENPKISWIRKSRRLVSRVDELLVLEVLDREKFSTTYKVQDPISNKIYIVKSCQDQGPKIPNPCHHEIQMTLHILENNRDLVPFLVLPSAYWTSKDSEGFTFFNILIVFYHGASLESIVQVRRTTSFR